MRYNDWGCRWATDFYLSTDSILSWGLETGWSISEPWNAFYIATSLMRNAGKSSHVSFSERSLMEGGVYPPTMHYPIYSTVNTNQPSHLVCRKAAPKHSSSTKQCHRCLFQRVLFWSHLTTWHSSTLLPLKHPGDQWQTLDGSWHVLAKE